MLKTTLTVASILFVFFGNLLGQLITAKSKNENDFDNVITQFFKKVDSREIQFTMLSTIINTMSIISFSLLALLVVDQYKSSVLKIWFFIFIIFITDFYNVYKIFIQLLLYQKQESKVEGKMTDSEEKAFNSKLNKKS